MDGETGKAQDSLWCNTCRVKLGGQLSGAGSDFRHDADLCFYVRKGIVARYKNATIEMDKNNDESKDSNTQIPKFPNTCI